MSIQLSAPHPSVEPKLIRKPKNMTKLSMSAEQRDFVREQAMSVFADCTSVGVNFADALVAIYLSGMEAANYANKKKIGADK